MPTLKPKQLDGFKAKLCYRRATYPKQISKHTCTQVQFEKRMSYGTKCLPATGTIAGSNGTLAFLPRLLATGSRGPWHNPLNLPPACSGFCCARVPRKLFQAPIFSRKTPSGEVALVARVETAFSLGSGGTAGGPVKYSLHYGFSSFSILKHTSSRQHSARMAQDTDQRAQKPSVQCAACHRLAGRSSSLQSCQIPVSLL